MIIKHKKTTKNEDYASEAHKKIIKLQEAFGNNFGKGSTEVQILYIQDSVNNLRHHMARNLLDPQSTSNEKTNHKDVPAINSLKQQISKIKRLIKYLKTQKKDRYNNLVSAMRETSVFLEKHV